MIARGVQTRRGAPLIALGVFMGACAHGDSGPERALEAYAQGLEARDAAEVWRRSDPAFRAALEADEVERFLRKNPATVERAEAALRSGVRSLRATVELESGDVVELVRVDGAWRIAEGPVPFPRLDDPERALRTFLFAARGHLSLLRSTMPDEERERFASDSALGQHLYAQADRIERLRVAYESGEVGPAHVEGANATLPWGTGRAVRLVLQGRTWRVVDLE